MDWVLHVNIYIFPMILLASIFVSMRVNSIKATGTRLFGELLLLTFMLLLSELLSWMVDGATFPGARVAAWGINFFYFILAPLIAIFWMNYINYYIYEKPLIKISLSKKHLILLPVTLYYIMLLTTPFTKLIFNIGADNTYVRGQLYYLSYCMNFLYLAAVIGMELYGIFKQKSAIKRKSYTYLLLFTLIPMFAGVAQLLANSTWIAYPCTALAELMLYIHLQNKSITTDALTGINNRGSFDQYLKEKWTRNVNGKSLYLFLIDIDHFKSINDNYGHDSGDAALILTTEIINDTFCRSDAFLARYGGDEFCIITECENEYDAQNTIWNLRHAFEAANDKSGYPFNIEFSAGYAPLDSKQYSSPEKAIKSADRVMYEQKQRRQEKCNP